MAKIASRERVMEIFRSYGSLIPNKALQMSIANDIVEDLSGSGYMEDDQPTYVDETVNKIESGEINLHPEKAQKHMQEVANMADSMKERALHKKSKVEATRLKEQYGDGKFEKDTYRAATQKGANYVTKSDELHESGGKKETPYNEWKEDAETEFKTDGEVTEPVTPEPEPKPEKSKSKKKKKSGWLSEKS
jgi:polyhydroxyalkanoate synthesis regulator phasin